MTKKELSSIRKQVEKIAVDAGKHIHRSIKSLQVVVQKERMDVATKMDLQTEEFIKKKLHALFPSHAFFAEESGGAVDENVPTWIIDPIDGTKEFVRDIPIFCTTFCLVSHGETLVSVVYNPRTFECFSAAKGLGAYKNGKKVKISNETEMGRSHIFFRLPDYSTKERMGTVFQLLEKLTKLSYRVRGIANQNIALCWVGMGGYDAYVNVVRSDNPWDYAAGSFFLEEAGGRLHLLVGDKLDRAKAFRIYIAGNHTLCNNLLSQLKTELKQCLI